jgi:predicted transcriptional regulator
MVQKGVNHRRSQIFVLGLVLLLAVNIPVGMSSALPDGPEPVARASSRACHPPAPDINGERWGDWVIDCPDGWINLTFESIKLHGSIIVTNGSNLRLTSSSKIIQLFNSSHHYLFKVEENAQLVVQDKSEIHADRFNADPSSIVIMDRSKLYTSGSLNLSDGILNLKDSYIENKAHDGTTGESGAEADLIINSNNSLFTGSTIVSLGGNGGFGKSGGFSNAEIFAVTGVITNLTLNISGGNGGGGSDGKSGPGSQGGPGGDGKLRILAPSSGNLLISKSSISVLGGNGGRGGNGGLGQSTNGGSGGDGNLGGLAKFDLSVKSQMIESSTIMIRGGNGGKGGTGGPTQNGSGGNGGAGGSGMNTAINISVTGALFVGNSSILSYGGTGGDGGFYGFGTTSQGIPGSAGNGGPSAIHLVVGSFKGINSTLQAVAGPGSNGGLGGILGGNGGFGGDAWFELRSVDRITNDGLTTQLSEFGSLAGTGGNGGDASGATGNGGGQAGPSGSGGSCTTILNSTNSINLKHTHLRCFPGPGGGGSSPGIKGYSTTTIDTIRFDVTASTIDGVLTGFDNNDLGTLRNSTVDALPIAFIEQDQCNVSIKVWWTLSVSIPKSSSSETWEVSVYSGPEAKDGNLVATAMVPGGPNNYATFELLGQTISCNGTIVYNYTVIGRNNGTHTYTTPYHIILRNNKVLQLRPGCSNCPSFEVHITEPEESNILVNDSKLAPCRPPNAQEIANNMSAPGCFVIKGDGRIIDISTSVIDDIKLWLVYEGGETYFFNKDSDPPVILKQPNTMSSQWTFDWDMGAWDFNNSEYLFPAGEWTIIVSLHATRKDIPGDTEGLWSAKISTIIELRHRPGGEQIPLVNAGYSETYTIISGQSGVEAYFQSATVQLYKNQKIIRYEWDFNNDNVPEWSNITSDCHGSMTCYAPSTSYIYTKPGNYTALFCVYDNLNKRICDYKNVQILKQNEPTTSEYPRTLFIGITVAIVIMSMVIIAALIIASLSEATKYSIMSFILVPLYTRLKKEEMLDNYTRGEIRGYIVANPGAHYSRIKRDLNLNNGTLIYHLSTLEREGFVYSHRDDYYRRFYPRGRKPRPGPNLTTVQESIIEILLDNPGLTTEDIAGKLNKSRKVTNYHLVWLRRSGLIEAKDDGRRKTYTVIYEDDVEASQDGIKEGLSKGLSKDTTEDDADEPSEP